MHAWHTARAHEGAATNILSKSSCSNWRVSSPPFCSHPRAPGGHSLETLDQDSGLAVGPKVALADDYRSQNSMEFVRMELGHRILKTEKPQKPKTLNI